jgi:hypothetical protein
MNLFRTPQNHPELHNFNDYFRSSTSLGQNKFFVKGLLIMLELIVLVFNNGSAAASIGVFQESPPSVTLEIRYQNPAAAKVYLVWGVNGWQPLSDEARPVGTELRNGNMFTPMLLEGDIFTIHLELPPGTTIDYGFLTTQDQEGNLVNIWEANGDKDFQTTTTNTNAVVNILTALSPVVPSSSGSNAGRQPVNLDIQYTSPSSGEVILVWGLNGWTLAPEEGRPTGTLVEENIMRTPMPNDGGTFVARLPVLPGTVVDFGFLTTRDSKGNVVEVWEANGSDDYHVTVNHDTVQKVQSQLALKTSRDLPSILVIGIYILIGVLVILIVGFVFRRSPG